MLSIGTATPCIAGVLSGPVVNPANGHTYYLLSQGDWTSSEPQAVSLGGHLVTIDDPAENAWVFGTFSTFGGTARALWIGYDDQASEGSFAWSSGEAPVGTHWSGGQPDNGFPGPDPPGEDFVHMLWPTHPNAPSWNDFQDLAGVNGFPLHGVVEVVLPCAASAVNYCTAGTTGNACRALMSSSGVPSASAGSDFTITMGSVEGKKQGVVFYGLSGPNALPWSAKSTSFLCVKAPTQRTGVQNSGGTSGACDGQMVLDWNAFIASKPNALGNPFAGGETVWVQGWFRDPSAPKTTSLSDGLTFCVGP